MWKNSEIVPKRARKVPKMAKNSKNHVFRLLIEFESFDLARNGLVTSATILHMLKIFEIGHHERNTKIGVDKLLVNPYFTWYVIV